jgi:hypothetical protein
MDREVDSVETKPAVAKLERVLLREIWGDEARNFTPWLASEEALGLLSEVIGYNLELIGTEVAVGPYSADILAKATGQEDHKIVVENQLGRTDHDHLGKMITYAAGLGAKTLIWVSDRFCEEHRAALDWLNQNTGEKLNFYGLEIRAFRIDNSRPAPQFSVISRPNSTIKAMREELSSSERRLKDDLIALAGRRHVEALLGTVLKLERPLGCVTSEPTTSYGGSIRCWRQTPEEKWKVVIGLNISGQRKQTPEGQLDVWLPIPSIATVTGTSVEEVRNALDPLPVLVREAVDWVVRLKSESDAEMVVRLLSEYFVSHPGSRPAEEAQPASDVGPVGDFPVSATSADLRDRSETVVGS